MDIGIVLIAGALVWYYVSTRSASPTPSGPREVALQAALGQIGVPYVWAGETPGFGFDCSGLTRWAYLQAGVDLPHNAALQHNMASSIGTPEAGDLVFFNFYGEVDHVGLVVQGDELVDASDPPGYVRRHSIGASGWWPYFVGYGRVA